ncbi:MAG: YdcF family protein [Ruminococcus sp.]|nr:YdcF family protein [Ruminococcus sp.]
MLVSELTEQNISDEIIDKLLFEGLEYKGDNGDLIVVLGSKKAPIYRMPVAERLYHSGKSSKIIVCGGKVRNFDSGKVPEWEAMKNAALHLGIKAEDILTEETSMTTYENLVNAEKIIRSNFPGCKSIILVTTAYHMRRALKMAEKILVKFNIIPCPANDGSTRRNTWFKTDKGRHTALDECMKFGYYIRNGCIDDFEI